MKISDKSLVMIILVYVMALTFCLVMFKFYPNKNYEIEPTMEHIVITPVVAEPIPAQTPVRISATYEPIIEEKETPEPRYGFTEDEVYLLAQLLCGDASIDGDGEYDFVWGAKNDNMNYYEMSKVLCVVMNRVEHDNYPDTVEGVVLQRGQFDAARNIHNDTSPDDIAIDAIRDWCDAFDRFDPGAMSIPDTHLFFDGNGYINNTRAVWR